MYHDRASSCMPASVLGSRVKEKKVTAAAVESEKMGVKTIGQADRM